MKLKLNLSKVVIKPRPKPPVVIDVTGDEPVCIDLDALKEEKKQKDYKALGVKVVRNEDSDDIGRKRFKVPDYAEVELSDLDDLKVYGVMGASPVYQPGKGSPFLNPVARPCLGRQLKDRWRDLAGLAVRFTGDSPRSAVEQFHYWKHKHAVKYDMILRIPTEEDRAYGKPTEYKFFPYVMLRLWRIADGPHGLEKLIERMDRQSRMVKIDLTRKKRKVVKGFKIDMSKMKRKPKPMKIKIGR